LKNLIRVAEPPSFKTVSPKRMRTFTRFGLTGSRHYPLYSCHGRLSWNQFYLQSKLKNIDFIGNVLHFVPTQMFKVEMTLYPIGG